ncbi:bifunctional aminoglycoside phosphotransferase/ATP-binding protein [Caenimonas sp. SL110]|uniref:bifunctional aminoglycoside phosphotransferase/ATP-binding protein n=1 Tax=Caenimonas sp. SL110 TaxID=1450524 RepID=UPI00069DE0E4|nr:bifunctional aminoglycoside phosphotransferase/ATP-binding protein [Caenimonas sp. SL110]
MHNAESHMEEALTLVQALARQLRAELIETHISWVLLAGETAYKIKKPVHLPFVDYSTLAARRHFCEEEVRLNRRLAPSLYLGVTRITGTCLSPTLDGPGAPIEYAVRMRRFPHGSLFSERLERQTLGHTELDALAALLAQFHLGSSPAAEAFATAKHRRAVALAALDGAAPLFLPSALESLHTWIETSAAALTPRWDQRLAQGHVRQCHGDLHLDNVVLLDEGVAAFDCIEFDPALSWIDVIDDIAFAVMDLAARGRRDFAFRLLNAWLDRTGDHAGLDCLAFACVYRALVRAQVEHMRGRVPMARQYAEAALSWAQPRQPHLYITNGLPGSGKTFQSQRLLEREGAIRLRSDVERKRLFGLGALDDSHAKGLDIYSAQATARTYAHLLATARSVLAAGYPVVIDAAFLLRGERAAARALADSMNVRFSIVVCQAPPSVLEERLRLRQGDASEADGNVLAQLRSVAQPLDDDEMKHALEAS